MSNIRKLIQEQKSLDDKVAEPFNLTAPGAGYTPAQIRSIYNVTPVARSPSSRPRVNITIIVAYHYANLKRDFDSFCTNFGTTNVPLPSGTLIQIAYGSNNVPYICNSNGTPSTTSTAGVNATQTTFTASPASWAKEACLNSQWAYAMNPNAIITVREAYSDSVGNLRQAMVDATASNADIIVMPFGTFENNNISLSYTSIDTAAFQNTSKCYLASTGDLKSVNWPASSNCILACGGTTLDSASPYTTRSSEIYWTTSSTSGGGKGVSTIYNLPTYQTGLANKRSIPDVSAIANPATGVQIYYSGSNLNINGGSGNTDYTTQATINGYTGSQTAFYTTIVAGGTSASTAVIAGILSNVIQRRKNLSLTNSISTASAALDSNDGKYSLQRQLYAIYRTSGSSTGTSSAASYATNIYNCSNSTSYSTDTGLGVINCNNLVTTLTTGSYA